jgi:integrase
VAQRLTGVRELRVREATVPLLDSFIQTVQVHRGTAAAKLARSVLSGLLGVAVGHSAIPTNPVRDLGRIHAGRRKATPSLTLVECRAWLAQPDAEEDARAKDLPDLCRFMIGTGLRIGEALAVAWPEVDLDAGTVDMFRTLIRLTVVGLIRKSTKTETGERILTLPRFVITTLQARNPDGDALGPVFPDSLGGWRDPSNTWRALRGARGSDGFAWVTSHVFRRTYATILDLSGQVTPGRRRSARPRPGLDDPELLSRPAHREPERCRRARRVARPGGRTSWVSHGRRGGRTQ